MEQEPRKLAVSMKVALICAAGHTALHARMARQAVEHTAAPLGELPAGQYTLQFTAPPLTPEIDLSRLGLKTPQPQRFKGYQASRRRWQ